MQIELIHSLTEVDALSWNALAGDRYPFLRHEFLSALEQSGAVSAKTGWSPHHLLAIENNQLLAVMPLYLKQHSRGEYVFDQQWANAYGQSGLAYYPKWLTAVPFTPCLGPRIAVKSSVDASAAVSSLINTVQALSRQHDISSWHCLFPEPAQLALFKSLGLSIREDVQFQWLNKGYRDFNDFLDTLTAGKRKMIRRERRKAADQSIELQQIIGAEADERQWQEFYQFYAMTYLKKGSQPYLSPAFFQICAATMGRQMLLVLAVKNQQYVGAALSFIGADTLYGRYWGCYEEYDALHFEACYYQGLDYCLEHGLQRFDSGAQGEHKIARGFEPVSTYSAHWLKNNAFAEAVESFLSQEKQQIALYKQDAARYLPFKKAD